MPSLSFVLPHWLYWSGLILFPLASMYIVRRQARRGAPTKRVSLAISYMLWLTGGFVGLHRFYLRSRLGAIYVPLFLVMLYGNVQGRQARDALSRAGNALLDANFQVERAQAAVTEGVKGAATTLAKAQQVLVGVRDQLAASTADFDFWFKFSALFALAIAFLLLIDAFFLPRLTRRCAEKEEAAASNAHGAVEKPDESSRLRWESTSEAGTALTDWIDRINGWTGHFVCYWSVIAVFVYYYEVLARYVFNSPTNWAHESMFLMFGMQYLISGAYTYREGGHVRVDVIYLRLPPRTRAIIDIITSVFFFLFTGVLLWTGWVFMMDSIKVWEVSFTEWAIQYWPVKSSMALGAFLILLQGIARLIKDVLSLSEKEA